MAFDSVKEENVVLILIFDIFIVDTVLLLNIHFMIYMKMA